MGRRNILLIALLVCLPGMLWAQGRPVVKGEACSGDLGGTYPGCTVVGAQTDAIDAAAIQTDAVGADEIATGAVGAPEIGTDAVNADEIATDAVGAPEIGTDAVNADEIATDAVGTAEIATGAVDSDEIATDAVGTAELDDNADTPAANELVRVDSSDTGAVEYGPTTISDTGAIVSPATTDPAQTLEDSTNDDSDADYAVVIVDNVSNDTKADFQVEVAGTLETWLRLDGLTNTIDVGHETGVTGLSLVTTDGIVRARDILTPSTSIVTTAFLYADAMSTDGTECSQAARTTINSGPVQWAIVCPMSTAETDGFVYGMIQLPGGFDGSKDIDVSLFGYLNADNGAGTWHGYLTYQCVANDDQIVSSWTAGAEADFVMDGTESIHDRVVANAGAFTATCTRNETLFLRWKACDTDATPSTNCTSSAGFENDIDIINMRVEYSKKLGD